MLGRMSPRPGEPFPAARDVRLRRRVEALDEDRRMEFEERAAILEFANRWTREAAEWAAGYLLLGRWWGG